MPTSYWCILSSTCFGYIRPSSAALHVELLHVVFCTEFVDGWWSWEPLYGADGVVRVARHHPHRTNDPRSVSQDHHPSKNSVQKTISCNSTSNAPDDGRMYLKHVELRIHQYQIGISLYFKPVNVYWNTRPVCSEIHKTHKLGYPYHQQMHIIYMKLQTIRIYELPYISQRYIAILRETLI